MNDAQVSFGELVEDRSEPSNGILRLTRRFNASQERVFNAFSKADQVAAWFGPEGLTCDIETFDARPGGRYSLVMINAENGDRYPLSGEFREIEPFERLSYTWQWGGEQPGKETLVTLEFRPVGDLTELTLTHTLHPDEHQVSNHGKGWLSSFRDLDRLLAR